MLGAPSNQRQFNMIKSDDELDPFRRPILYLLVKILCIMAIISLICLRLHSIPAMQSKVDIIAKYRYNSSPIDREELENAILAISTTFAFIIHVIGLLAVIREHHWLLFTYSTYLSASVLFNILTVVSDPPQIVAVIMNLATGLLTFTLGLMARNRSMLPLMPTEDQI